MPQQKCKKNAIVATTKKYHKMVEEHDPPSTKISLSSPAGGGGWRRRRQTAPGGSDRRSVLLDKMCPMMVHVFILQGARQKDKAPDALCQAAATAAAVAASRMPCLLRNGPQVNNATQ